MVDRLAERRERRDPPLLHAGRGQAGRSGDVADGEDVRDRGPVLLVDLDAAALVALQARVVEREPVGRALAAGRVHQRVGDDLLAGLQPADDAVVAPLDADHLLAEAEGHVALAQQEPQRDADVAVDERQQPVARVDERHPDAHRGEHRGVLDADHPAADDRHRLAGGVVEAEHAVGVDHPAVVEVDALGARRVGADRDHDLLGGDVHLGAVLVAAGDVDRVRVLERRGADQQADAVAAELLAHDRGLVGDDVGDAVVEHVHARRALALGVQRVGEIRCRARPSPRGSTGAATWTGSCRCGWRRRRCGRGAPRRRRACRASRPGWRRAGRRDRSR